MNQEFDASHIIKKYNLNSKSQRILCLNRYTWKLLGAIYQNKLDTSLDETSDTDSHLSAINRLYTRDEEIRHYQVVLDWLESNAAELLPDLPTKVNTVYKVCFELWSGNLSNSFEDIGDSPSILIEIISELTSCFVRFFEIIIVT